jgi:S-adenosylmethionine decarboxylase proenzyme
LNAHTSFDSPLSNLGRHLLAEFYDCNSNLLNNCALIEEMMETAAVRCGATVVQKNFHMFNPYGVSGVVIIAESHLAIHTWPEHGYAAVDLFTCGDNCDPEVAYDYLRQELRAGSAIYTELKRGLFNEETRQMVQAPFRVETERTHSAPLGVPVGVDGGQG